MDEDRDNQSTGSDGAAQPEESPVVAGWTKLGHPFELLRGRKPVSDVQTCWNQANAQ